jgi:hypothetical protein
MNSQQPYIDPPQSDAPQEPAPTLPPVQQLQGATAPDFGGTVPAGQTMPVSSSLVPMPDSASDSDLIEKEWVLKAKQIVEHTLEDPFSQQEQLSKMKADYVKKRYNKDLGVK